MMASEFVDWQVILLTHDQSLSRTIDSEVPDWLRIKGHGLDTTTWP
jgi:hypothetical protein